MQELKVAIRFNLLHFCTSSFCISLELLSFHSFKVWKVSGLGFNAANRSSFHFPKSLFGDIGMICLWFIWRKFKFPGKLKLCPHWYPIRALSWEGALLLMRKIFSICSPRKTRFHPWDHRLKSILIMKLGEMVKSLRFKWAVGHLNLNQGSFIFLVFMKPGIKSRKHQKLGYDTWVIINVVQCWLVFRLGGFLCVV